MIIAASLFLVILSNCFKFCNSFLDDLRENTYIRIQFVLTMTESVHMALISRTFVPKLFCCPMFFYVELYLKL